MGNSNSRTVKIPFRRAPLQPPQAWVWRCNIPGREGYGCTATFHTAPDLQRHYRDRHGFTPRHISRYQDVLMRRLPRPPLAEEDRPDCPTVRQFIRRPNYDQDGDSDQGSGSDKSAGFVPHWPKGPVDNRYGPWAVRPKRPSDALKEARKERDKKNTRGWERILVPNWYYEEVSRRVRMRRGEMWP
jgi:hypothetical protein